MSNFNRNITRSIENILRGALNGDYPTRVGGTAEDNFFGQGFILNIGENALTARTPSTRNIVTQEPKASIIVKKKEFSSFKHVNDLKWMDRTERMLIRSMKALFAYKVAQIRAYESLTKFEDDFKDTGEISLNLFANLLYQARFLGASTQEIVRTSNEAFNLIINSIANSIIDLEYDLVKEDVIKILKRNAFQVDIPLTTWIVDPENIDNFGTGPGTGAIELGQFYSISCGTDLNPSPSSASFRLEDPYKISKVTEEDISIAIEEAMIGSVGILERLISGDVSPSNLEAKSVVAASFEMAGLGGLGTGIDTKYIREQMRKFYLGKPFINAGDSVHIYMRGNRTIQDYRNEDSSFDDDYLAIDDTILEAERNLFTNKSIDLETYKKLRKMQDNSLSMQHVFGGLITLTSRSYNNGKWTLSVNCIDNMGWLNWSRFMIEPALQDPQGILEDPLTPFEITTDALGIPLVGNGPQLLSENKELLNSGLLTYDSGILNGRFASENNLFQGQYNGSGSLQGSKILQHPNGFVYRWKTGIITATAGVTLSDPINEKDVTLNVLSQKYGLTVAENVLTNLDAANIISLLVLGQPYNVESFLQQAYQAHNLSNQTSASSLSPNDPLTSVLDVIRRQNIRFGYFRPYRMITLSRSTLEQTASSNIIRTEINENLKLFRQRRLELKNILSRLEVNKAQNKTLINTIREEIQVIDLSIEEQIRLATETRLSSSDIVTENFNLFGRNRVLPLTGNFDADYEITRAMMIVGAQRKIEDVRLNTDNNLLIISDQYEQNTDIRPYILKLRDSKYQIFRGTYLSVFEKCKQTADIVNFEFFCNPQGHLEFRPPQWNKTPASILARLFEEEGREGGIIPDFLKELFESRSASLRREIHSLNVRIVMLSLLLGKFPDGTIIPNFRDPEVVKDYKIGKEPASKGYLRFFGVSPKGLADTGKKRSSLRAPANVSGKGNIFNIGDLVNTGNQLIGQGLSPAFAFGEDGDVINGDTSTLLGIFDPIFQEEKNLVNNVLTTAQQTEGFPAEEYATAENLNNLRREFRRVGNIDPAPGIVSQNNDFTSINFVFNKSLSEVQRIQLIEKYLESLQETISNRDRLVTILTRNEERRDQLEEAESILSGEFTAQIGGSPENESEQERRGNFERGLDAVSNTLNKIQQTTKTFTDILTGDATRGTLYDHLVEYDNRNLLGPGSGRRFIIEDHDIISCTYTEQPPDFNRINIVGNAPFISSSLQRSFEERYFWAGATDFDLWRQYGFKEGGVKNLPFANDPELQCRPFAIMELQVQKAKINKAEVTVVGNEYYAPGDVVYVRDQELLYYVNSVRHSFDYGGSFTTQLVLENGHPPGVYLPSPLDIIGQQLTKDPLTGTFLVYRNQNGDDNYRALQPDSNLIFPNIEIDQSNINVLLDFKNNQVRYTNMIIDLNTIAYGERVVLLRGFVTSADNEEDVKKRLAITRYLLENPQQISQVSDRSLGDDFLDFGNEVSSSFGITTGNTKSVIGMSLPNGISANPIPPDRIVEQIVYLNSENDRTEIQCLSSQLLSPDTLNKEIKNQFRDSNDYISVFPKGGPKQNSWLDLRDNLASVNRIIEIGILNVKRKINKEIRQSATTIDEV